MNKPRPWEKDFQDFMAAAPETPPPALSEIVLRQAHEALHPSAALVFAKLFGVHLLAGAATLLACPQFGVSFTSSMGLMHYLMPYGDIVCMLGCGAIFMSLSLFFSAMLFKPEEVLALKKNSLFQLTLIASLSLFLLIMVGGEASLLLALYWIAGAVLGGMLWLEFAWNLRKLFWRSL